MYRLILIAVAAVFVASLFAEPAMAQRGRGGGGGARAGGGGGAMRGGGAARSPSMSRANFNRPSGNRPSMSRPNVGRPNVGGGAARPNMNRPTVSRPSVNLPTGGNRPDFGGANRPNFGGGADRPDFGGGNRPDFGGGAVRPDFGGADRPNFGGGGDRPNFGGGGDRPNFGGGDRPGFGGDNPNFVNRNRPSSGDLGSFLDLPGGATRPAQRPDFGGGNNRPNLGEGNRPNFGGDNRPNVDRDNVGNRLNTGDVNLNINREQNFNSIRNQWNNVGINDRPFNNNWWATRPTTLPAWRWCGNWGNYAPGWCWRPGTWAGFGTWFAWSWAEPVIYDYGSEIVYRDNYVYMNDEQVASAADYYQQAETVATSIPQNVDEQKVEWMPLGVFAITEENGTDSGMLLQLAVSKEGIIAGTFYNNSTSDGRPVEGTVDRDSQRAAWHFSDGKNSEIVMETAIYNLTQDQSTALVHFGPDRQETWQLVRLPAPEDSDR